MYSLSDYGDMIADHIRMDAYAYALKSVVTPGSVVLDIGTATGIHALLACKFGARKVYAVESNDVIHIAQDLAEANSFGDRIEFMHDLSTNISLPEPADIIVSDLRGQLPLYGHHIPAIIDARSRHLAPLGTMIPRRDKLWVGLVEGKAVYDDLVAPWDSPYGLNMDLAKEYVLNSWSSDGTETFRQNNLLTTPTQWLSLDYATIQNPNVKSPLIEQTATRDGTAHGLLVWFDAELTDDVGFSNAPNSDRIAEVYGRGFFPFGSPVPVAKDDIITLRIEAELVGDDYVWHWHTRICDGDDVVVVRADYQHTEAS